MANWSAWQGDCKRKAGCQESLEWNTGMEYWNGLINSKNLKLNYFIKTRISDIIINRGTNCKNG